MANSANTIGNPLGDPSKYGSMLDGDIDKLVDFSSIVGETRKSDKELLDTIKELYGKALESVGLNFMDPMEAYGTHFNRHNSQLGLDPQTPGIGFTFFTRPKLYLSLENMRAIPFIDYISNTEIGKMALEQLHYPNDSSVHNLRLQKKFKSDSVFDVLKTNTCTELSGLKDYVVEKYETEADFRGNQLQYASGIDGVNSIGEVTATFYDPYRSPIFINTLAHVLYIIAVTNGSASPRRDDLLARIIDYTFSIYTIKLAEDNETIIRWGRLMGCMPLNVPMATVNYSNEKKNDEYSSITVNYGYNRYSAMDPADLADLNFLSYKSMAEDADDPQSTLVKPTAPTKFITASSKDTAGDPVWARSPYIVGNKLVFI